MRSFLDILTDEKNLMDEISSIEQSLLHPESPTEKEKLENQLTDLQMELGDVTEEIRDYLKLIQE